jgi:hypothetical protein
VYEGGLSLKEVYEEVELYEVDRLLKEVYRRHKAVWEANRMTAFVVAQTHSKNKLKPTSLIKFPWEKEMQREEIVSQMEGRTQEYQSELSSGAAEMGKLF